MTGATQDASGPFLKELDTRYRHRVEGGDAGTDEYCQAYRKEGGEESLTAEGATHSTEGTSEEKRSRGNRMEMARGSVDTPY